MAKGLKQKSFLVWVKSLLGPDISPQQKLKTPMLFLTATVFAVIGSIVIYRSFAAGPVMSTEGEGSASNRSGRLAAISDTSASGGQYVQFGTGTTSGTRVRYEARHATDFGPVTSTSESIRLEQGLAHGSSGDMISYFQLSGDYVTFTVNVPSAGSYTIDLGYAIALQVIGQPNSLRRNMIVNGGAVRVIDLPMTTNVQFDWDNPNAYVSFPLGNVQLNAGNNSITFSIGSGSDIYPWNVDYLDVYGAVQPGDCPSGQIGVPPNCVAIPASTTPPTDPPVTPPVTGSGNKCVVGHPGSGGSSYLGAGFGSGVGYPLSSSWTTIGNNNHDSADTVRARIPSSCGQIIVHGFSLGAQSVAGFYCAGETFGGRVIGYIFDQPAHWGGDCSRKNPAHRVILYDCKWGYTSDPNDWATDAILNNYGGLQRMANNLGTTIQEPPAHICNGSLSKSDGSPRNLYHSPYVDPMPPAYSTWW